MVVKELPYLIRWKHLHCTVEQFHCLLIGRENQFNLLILGIAFVPPEYCEVLRGYSELHSQCVALGTCSGVQCQLSDSVASFAVTKCVDPVVVDVRLQSRSTGQVSVQRAFNQSDSVIVEGGSLYVEVGRNATDLLFEVTAAN